MNTHTPIHVHRNPQTHRKNTKQIQAICSHQIDQVIFDSADFCLFAFIAFYFFCLSHHSCHNEILVINVFVKCKNYIQKSRKLRMGGTISIIYYLSNTYWLEQKGFFFIGFFSHDIHESKDSREREKPTPSRQLCSTLRIGTIQQGVKYVQNYQERLFTVNFEHISHFALVFLLLNSSR